MNIPLTGGCSCGAICYECTAEPLMMLKCHCRECQHVTGGGFAAAVLVPAEAFRLTRGQLRYHFTPRLGGGRHTPGLCPGSESPITRPAFDEYPAAFVGL